MILCRTSISSTSVEHWYNTGYVPNRLISTDPQLGLSNFKVIATSDMFICTFTRMNVMKKSFGTNYTEIWPNYYIINNASLPYIISAFGAGDFLIYLINKKSSKFLSFFFN